MTKKRSIGIIIIAILQSVIGIYSLAFFLLWGGIDYVGLIITMLPILVGIGLIFLKNWARILAMFFIPINLSLLTFPHAVRFSGYLWDFKVTHSMLKAVQWSNNNTIIALLIIFYLIYIYYFTRPEVKELFK